MFYLTVTVNKHIRLLIVSLIVLLDVWKRFWSRPGLEPEHETHCRPEGPDREHPSRKDHRRCHQVTKQLFEESIHL